MKVIVFSFIFSLSLISCGFMLKDPDHDSRFDPIISQFKKDAEFFGVDLAGRKMSVSFGDPNERVKYGPLAISKEIGHSVNGACFHITTKGSVAEPIGRASLGKKHGIRFIIIDKSFENAAADFLEVLVYHELAHCLLDQGHREDSIMTENELMPMREFRYFYLRELFTKRPMDVKILHPIKEDEKEEDSEIIYDVDYEVFGQKITHTLRYNKEEDKFLFTQ